MVLLMLICDGLVKWCNGSLVVDGVFLEVEG